MRLVKIVNLLLTKGQLAILSGSIAPLVFGLTVVVDLIVVALLEFAVAAMLLVFYKELESSLIRVKGF